MKPKCDTLPFNRVAKHFYFKDGPGQTSWAGWDLTNVADEATVWILVYYLSVLRALCVSKTIPFNFD